MIKPNNHELSEIFDVMIDSKEKAVVYAKELQKKGAKNVIVSMAGEGAVFVGSDGSVFTSEAPHGVVKNSVGAGDSMVAGFLAGYLAKGDYAEALNGTLHRKAQAHFQISWQREKKWSRYDVHIYLIFRKGELL